MMPKYPPYSHTTVPVDGGNSGFAHCWRCWPFAFVTFPPKPTYITSEIKWMRFGLSFLNRWLCVCYW